jgi:hypothetical protein
LPVSPGGQVGGAGVSAAALALIAGAVEALGGVTSEGVLALGEGGMSAEATGALPFGSSLAHAERAKMAMGRRAVGAKGNRMGDGAYK